MELWSCKFTFQFPPRSCPEALDDENPSTSRIFLVRIEDVLKPFEAKLGGPIMSVRCIPGHQVSQMNRHIFHLICKIHRRLCHQDLQNLKLPTAPQVHLLQAQNAIHSNPELITHFSAVCLYLSSQLTCALYHSIIQGNLVIKMANIYQRDLPLLRVQLRLLMTGHHSVTASNSSSQIFFTVKKKCRRETSTIFLNCGRFL